MSDEQLAQRVMNGSEAAFRALYRRHTPALFPFVLRLVGGDEMTAEDVVQDTWVSAVAALPRFRWQSSFRSWLIGIGLNRARELLRTRARRDRLLEERGPRGPALIPAPAVEERTDLERAVDALPEGYRVVLVLHDVEGFTHPEIAERLDIAVGTSRSQLHHARRALRRALGNREEGTDEPIRA